MKKTLLMKKALKKPPKKMSSTAQQVVEGTVGISCHAWGPGGRELAYSPNNNELRIVDSSSVTKEKFRLTDHDMTIAAIDWHPDSNFIVTCSHDRNAFVWNFDEGERMWKPSLVILRIERAALCVQWSPDGQKFAVGSSAKCVPVCYYEKDNNWWVSKMIKKHKSSVLSIAWHPNSQILATGSSDFKARVFSAFVQGVDAGQSATPFGEVHAEYSSSGWVHAVAYSPDGKCLAFCGHDSSIHFVGEDGKAEQTIKFSFLPLTQLVFRSNSTCVGAGHDMNPAVFRKSNDSWGFEEFADKKKQEDDAKNKAKTNDVKARMAMWQNKDKTGQATTNNEMEWLKHQGPVTCLKLKPDDNKLSTTSPDGKLVLWTVN